MSQNETPSFEELNEQRKREEKCDVIIQIDDQTFPCHRAVLSFSSSYFKAMFDGKYTESESELVTIQELDPKAFEEILEAMYTGKITITKQNACRLLKACTFLRLREFEKSCISFAEKNQLIDNILEMCVYACFLNETKLFSELAKCIAKNFVDLSETYDFSSLSLQVFQTILSQETLDRRNDVVLLEIGKWIKKNSVNDSSVIEKLLKVAKLGTIRCSVLGKLLLSSENLLEISDTVKVERNPKSKETLQITESSEPTLKVYLKAATSEKSDLNCFITLAYAPDNERKWILTDVLQPFHNLKTVMAGKRQYFLSYRSGVGAQFWMVEDGESTTLRSPPSMDEYYELVALKETVFVYFTKLDRSCLYFYNSELDKWFSSPDMKTPVNGAAFIGYDNTLYLFGGLRQPANKSYGYYKYFHQVQRWDARRLNWDCVNITMYNPKTGIYDAYDIEFCHGAAYCGEGFAFFSGSSYRNEVSTKAYVYSIEKGRLEELKNLNVARSNHTLTLFNNEIYAIDNNLKTPFSYIEKLDIRNRTTMTSNWIAEPPIPQKIVDSGKVFWTKDVTAAVVGSY